MLIHLGRGRAPLKSRPSAISWFRSPSTHADGVAPVLYADFVNDRYAVNGAEVPFSSLYTFSRALAATYYGADGLLKTAASGERRIDFDPLTGARLGLLKEDARTNLFLYSGAFGNAVWNINVVVSTKVASTETDPTGAQTATLLQEVNLGVGNRYCYQDAAYTSGTAYTISVFAKAQGGRSLQMVGGTLNAVFTANDYCNFDLVNGVVGTKGSGVSRAEMRQLPNGWYRCSMTVTAAATATGRMQFNSITTASSSRNESYTGDGTSGIHVFGAQSEAGPRRSSYIATTSATVTRPADIISNGSGNVIPFASWYNSTSGTLYGCGTLDIMGTAKQPRLAEISAGAAGLEQLVLFVSDSTNDKPAGVVKSGGAESFRYEAAAYTEGAEVKMALSAAANNGNAAVNGISGTTDTSVTMPTPDRLYIGDWSGVSQPWIGHIKEIRYYNFNATQGECERITTPDYLANYRVVAKGGYMPINQSYVSGYTRGERRSRVLFGGQNCDEVRLVFWNGYIYQGEISGANSITIDAGLERVDVPQTVMFTFDGGSATKALAAGEWCVTDPIKASAFGLSNFTANSDFRARTGVVLANGTQGWPYTDSTPEVISGQRTAVSNSASSQISATGALVTPSGGISNSTTDANCFSPLAIIGKWTGTPDISVFIQGDSIMQKALDVADDGTVGGGFGVRAMRSVGGRSVPHINMARSAERAEYYTEAKSRLRRFMMQFCTHMLDEMGVNDVSAGTAAAQIVTYKSIPWQHFKRWGKGSKYIAQTSITTRTTSTDNWATVANQTPVSGFGSGEVREQLNASLAALPTNVSQFIDLRSATNDATVPQKWPATGSPYGYTGDGTHPSPTAHTSMAALVSSAAGSWS